MNKDDAITVITTVRDGDAFLDGYFANLCEILRPQDGAILVDDGSVNPVMLPDQLKQVKLIRSTPIGRGAALNLAISNAKNCLIAIQDIDDLSQPNRLSIQAAFLMDRSNALAFATGQETATPNARNPWQQIPATRLYRSNPLHHSSLAFHRNIWEMAGRYDPALPCCIDLDFYLRAASLPMTSIWLFRRQLITRNTDPATRYFASIPDPIYQKTLRIVLARHRRTIAPPRWMRIFDLKRLSGIGR